MSLKILAFLSFYNKGNFIGSSPILPGKVSSFHKNLLSTYHIKSKECSRLFIVKADVTMN
jgi:hypothetical protein